MGDQIAKKKKKKKKKKSGRIFFLCAVVIVWISQKYAITISTFVSMQDCFDEQII